MCSFPDNLGPQPNSREAALRFLDSRINYERFPSAPYGAQELKLERMRQLLARLKNPHDGLSVVHIAGTKGKGSTSAVICRVLTAAGYRTGLFTSPHLDRLEERVAIGTEPCTSEELVDLVRQAAPAVEAMDREIRAAGSNDTGPTYFEVITAMALLYFAQRGVDAVVLEVGMGGRLDATNVCQPLATAITSIGFDHTQQLGNTLRSIATEKAGIVKAGIPLVSGVTQSEPRAVIRQICRERRSPLLELGVDFDFQYRPPRRLELNPAPGAMDFYRRPADSGGGYRDLALGLVGSHQASNAAVALTVLGELHRLGWTIPEEAVRRGLAEADWPARVEVLSRRPTIILDSAHNPSSIEALVRVLEESFSARRRLLVFASTKGKDVDCMLPRLLGHFDEVIFTKYLTNPRSVPPEELASAAGFWAGPQRVCPDPASAWDQVRSLAGPQDLVCVTGSFFIAAEMGREIRNRPMRASGE